MLAFRSARAMIMIRNSCTRLLQLNSLFMTNLNSSVYQPNCYCKLMMANCGNSCAVKYSSTPELEDPKKLTNEDWEKRLTSEQYYVCREKGTEAPFSGKYYKHNEEGIYKCVCCNSELFSSATKFDSGTGWPSFYEAVGAVNGDQENSTVLLRPDNSLGMTRTEALCKKCNCHLGHIFDDGPPPSGLRFCINSMCLKFEPKKIK